jgi:superfamily II DNA or RNA helicase
VQNRTPVVLTKYKEHARLIYDSVQDIADYVFLLYGDNTDKENEAIKVNLKNIPNKKSVILIATGQKIGEGFDYPRLDTLMLVSPVSFGGRLEQYVGRLNRDYDGKKDVIVYDYIDSHIPVFNNMYLKRMRTYKKIGFSIVTNLVIDKQNVNAIYNSDNYIDTFEQDIIEAEKEIIISSPGIIIQKIERLIFLTKSRQESGVKVTVIIENPDNSFMGNAAYTYNLIEQMKSTGINVVCVDNNIECFAVIDRSLVWHGGMNLLGKEDVWDNLIRVRDLQAAAELLVLSFGNND